MKKLVFLLCLILAGCSGSKPGEIRPPRLAVVLVVDQMRADYLVRFRHLYTGGLARLQSEGVSFTNAHQDHALTETAPGHASISTGLFPAHHGIIANSWWDRTTDRSTYAVDDTVSVLEIPGEPGSSPRNLLGTTLGDWLKQASPNSKVYSVALKDRAAVLMGGQYPDAAYWYYDPGGRFVTSRHYMEEYPDWVTEFNESGLVDSYFEAGWTKMMADTAYRVSRQDRFSPEWDGEHTTFPHVFSGNAPGPNYYSELRYAPFGDDLAFAFARELIEQEDLGDDDTPDLLFISASAADGIGHAFGPYSQEVQDYYLRLDHMVGAFLDYLDRRIDPERYTLVLTADHGVLPMPEELRNQGVESRRMDPQKTLQPVINEAREKNELPPFQTVYANGILIKLPTGIDTTFDKSGLTNTMAEALREHEHVADIYTADELLSSDTPDRPYMEAYRRSFNPDRSPDLMIRLNEHLLPIGQPTFTTHGSPYLYDTHIPIIFYSPYLIPAQYNQHTRSVDIAPTLALILEIPIPTAVDGSPLTQAVPKSPVLP